MNDEHIKTLIKEVLQEENSQRTKALQKEKAMRVQMYKDSIVTVVGSVIISLIPLLVISWAGFNFLTGVVVTVFAILITVMIYESIKDDNRTREKRVDEVLKQVN